VVFIAELNGLEVWCTDVGNAYLESYTKEKVYIIGGPEFTPFGWEGHVLFIDRALYGLKSSGLMWWDKLADVLRMIGFTLSKAESDIWMRPVDDHYELLCVHVDDIIICSKKPQDIINQLEQVHKFSLKGTGPINYHLGCDYVREPNGTLCYGPRRYIDKMEQDFIAMFGTKPKAYVSPLEPGDHPEFDESDLLDFEGIKQYQSLIGSIQWAVQLGRFDVATATMTLSAYRSAPRVGHLKRAKHFIGYLVENRNGMVRVHTDLPDFSGIEQPTLNWSRTPYEGACELIDPSAPEPLGKAVRCTTFVDANLYHCHISGRAVTGILHFLNGTPVDWFSKKQTTVQTATFGSEFVAARIATDQIIANRVALRYLGVPIEGHTILYGDNRSVVENSTIPHSRLNKRHIALSYHRVREAICADIMMFIWLDSKTTLLISSANIGVARQSVSYSILSSSCQALQKIHPGLTHPYWSQTRRHKGSEKASVMPLVCLYINRSIPYHTSHVRVHYL
jgi:Reverse transcriptase (RNA-dependent DNA polymerase)